MKQKQIRMMITAADIIAITGLSERTAWRMMAAIRDNAGKKRYARITLQEFCSYTGFLPQDVLPYLE